ncbi:DEAD/DEAH box helicase [Melittangium boletus]|uniref:DEAD/DEAH box helicase n=1 Tax=Melittangium boletus TaxID=83453 RepID=UPI003DA54E41
MDPSAPLVPHALQKKVLVALADSRSRGRRRALVVMATGLGKTLVAVEDVAALERERGRPARVLVLAHRVELLQQTAQVFERQRRGVRLGWCVADRSELDGQVVLASVQKLSSPEHLARLAAAEPFDYVVVDEVHHAAAPSYRALLARLAPDFLLGLTATPERADEGDILGLFDDHLAYRVDVGEGIVQGFLVPFAYHGLRDDVAYAHIPWRGRRFDPVELARAVQTQERMARLWEAWEEYPGRRTLVFCCSIAHAEFARDWLRARGVRVEAVHSGACAEERARALEALAEGTLEALCAVDLLNEGVDLPGVDRVVMLRPSESPVVFLQQLGRGLRKARGKPSLTVLDFVGNHQVFLDRLRGLFALLGEGNARLTLRDYLVDGRAPELPPGCSLQVELEAKELLVRLLPEGRTAVERVYRELRTARCMRPLAGELYRLGYLPMTLRAAHGGWLRFVQAEGDLTPEEARVLEAGADWFDSLEGRNPVSRWLVLKVLLEAGALLSGMSLEELAARSQALVTRRPELAAALARERELGEGWTPASDAGFRTAWAEQPLESWAGPGLRLEEGLLVACPRLPGDEREEFIELTRELVDHGLFVLRDRERQDLEGPSFETKVLRNARHPILKLPSRAKRPEVPVGDLVARLPDGARWCFRMMKEFCNVAGPEGDSGNELPGLLRGWFGPEAGVKGTAFYVRFTEGVDGWRVEPVRPDAEVRGA